jgi:activating signal cointegrator 1
MRAISLWQPWASAVVLGIKTIETRGKLTHCRGPLLIHAAAKSEYVRYFRSMPRIKAAFARCGITDSSQFPLGKIIGRVELEECKKVGYAESEVDSPRFGSLRNSSNKSDMSIPRCST